MAQVKKTESSNVRKDKQSLFRSGDQNTFYPIAAILVIAVGLFLVINSPKNNNTNQDNTQNATAEAQISKPKNLAYSGQDGKVALAILKEVATIETSGEGENAFVTSINGYKPDVNKEFWALYVNGKMAEAGAGTLMTKNSDLIEWRLEEIKAQ